MNTLDEKRDHAADKLAVLLNNLTDYDPHVVTLTEALPVIDAIADHSLCYVVDQIYRMADCHHESQSGLLPKSQKQY